jgi:NAD(P)-dependent dehydrogenase (short-subunit alcohol dehydrogenase family)
MSDLLDLDGRVALVTGAGQGVGRQIALDLAGHGAGAVIVNDFFKERAEEIAGPGVRGIRSPSTSPITPPSCRRRGSGERVGAGGHPGQQRR